MSSELLAGPSVVLITGNMASGKSSVAQALAERAPRSVHLRGDTFRKMVVSGRAEPGFEMSSEALSQLSLRYEVSAQVASEYVRAGFLVVYQDVIVGPMLREVVALYRAPPLRVFVLQPSTAALAERDRMRPKTTYASAEQLLSFDALLREQTPRLGYWVDSSTLTVAQTVDELLTHWDAALISS